jgi:hypothetical protein
LFFNKWQLEDYYSSHVANRLVNIQNVVLIETEVLRFAWVSFFHLKLSNIKSLHIITTMICPLVTIGHQTPARVHVAAMLDVARRRLVLELNSMLKELRPVKHFQYSFRCAEHFHELVDNLASEDGRLGFLPYLALDDVDPDDNFVELIHPYILASLA